MECVGLREHKGGIGVLRRIGDLLALPVLILCILWLWILGALDVLDE